MKDLILATSFGYSYEQLAPFVRSLKKTGFDGEFVLFVANTTPKTISRLREEGVQVKKFFYPYKRSFKLRNPLYRLWPLVRPFIQGASSNTILRFCGPFQNLTILRCFLYQRFLRASPGKYRFVFLTDLRDVYFQKNPFLRASRSELRVFLEEQEFTLGGCQHNTQWLRELFGEKVVQELAEKPIACSGTILADYAGMINYLDQFLLALRDAQSVMRMGMDQGIFNYVVYKMLPNPTFCRNRTSEVLTMGLISQSEDLPRNAENHLVDQSGMPYSVVHQFDRHPSVEKNIATLFQEISSTSQ